MSHRRNRPVDVVGNDHVIPPTPSSSRQQLPTPTSSRRRLRSNNNKSQPSSHSHTRSSSPISIEPPMKSSLIVPESGTTVHSQLPTPQTLPRKRKAAPTRLDAETLNSTKVIHYSSTDMNDLETLPTPPSPSGHTTFFLSTHAARGSAPPRRRPGLLFAQQMGLLNHVQQSQPQTQTSLANLEVASNIVASSSSSRQQFGPRLNGASGAGIGMGGGLRTSTGHGRIVLDRMRIGIDASSSSSSALSPSVIPHRPKSSGVRSNNTLDPVKYPPTPGHQTSHLPRGSKHNTEMASPTVSLQATSGSRKAPPTLIDHDLTLGQDDSFGADQTHRGNSDRTQELTQPPPSTSGTGLLSPPPTKRSVRIRDGREEMEKDRRRAERKRMMDEDENPFLTRPGEIVRPGKGGDLNDEDKPFITYVFRGTKKTFLNPFVQLSAPYPESGLDPSDPEFDPHPCPAPRLLWPSATPGAGSSISTVSAGQTTPRSRSRPTGSKGTRGRDDEVLRTPSRPRLTSSKMLRSDSSIEDREDEEMEDEEESFDREEVEEKEEQMPVRRGLLFGPGAMKRMKM